MAKNIDAETRNKFENEVYVHYINGVPRRHIIAYANEKGWGVTETTIDSYIAKAKARAKKSSIIDHDTELGRSMTRLNDLYRIAITKGDLRLARNVVGDIIDLLGLAAPEKQEITHTIDTGFDDLRKRIDDICAAQPDTRKAITRALQDECRDEITPEY